MTNLWMLPEEVFAWLQANFPPETRVLELGSGEGTPRLCGMFAHVVSVEHDPAFLYRTPAEYVYAPLVDGWYDVAAVTAALEALPPYDLLLIDGPPGETRPNVAAHFGLFDSETPVLYDDTDRADDRAAAETIGRLTHRVAIHHPASSRGVGKMFTVIQ